MSTTSRQGTSGSVFGEVGGQGVHCLSGDDEVAEDGIECHLGRVRVVVVFRAEALFSARWDRAIASRMSVRRCPTYSTNASTSPQRSCSVPTGSTFLIALCGRSGIEPKQSAAMGCRRTLE
jgi:hypothetical protein